MFTCLKCIHASRPVKLWSGWLQLQIDSSRAAAWTSSAASAKVNQQQSGSNKLTAPRQLTGGTRQRQLARMNDQKVGQMLSPSTRFRACNLDIDYRCKMDSISAVSSVVFVCRFVVTFSPLSSMVEWVLRCEIECWIRLYHNCMNKKKSV